MEVFILSDYNTLIENYNATKPKAVNGLLNSSVGHYKNDLYRKFKSLFLFENLPDTYDVDLILDTLFRNGVMGMIVDSNIPYCLPCSYTGYNVNYKPTKVVVSNPIIGNYEGEIGNNSELLYFNFEQNMFTSIMPLIDRYAILLADCDCTINMSLINSRVAHIFTGETTAEVNTMKKIYDNVTKGFPAVFLKKFKPNFNKDTNAFLNVKQIFIAPECQELKQAIKNEFLTDIGIDNANNQKKERMIVDEVNANNQEVKTLINMYVDTLNACLQRANEMHARLGIEYTNMKVTLKEPKKEPKEEPDNEL